MGWQKIFHANGNQKKVGVAMLMSGKINFKIRTVTRGNNEHYIMIKGLIFQEDLTIINIYAPNIGASHYIRQMLTAIKVKINSNSITVRNFSTPLTPMDWYSRQKINKETEVLSDTLDKTGLIDIYRILQLRTSEIIFF